jgi:hypothetical protein
MRAGEGVFQVNARKIFEGTFTMNIRTLSSILVLASMLVTHWAHAADGTAASTRAETARSHCVEGVADCGRGAAADDHRSGSVRQELQQSCPADAQDCDTRGESQRDRAESRMRDRHAGRD